MLKCLIATCAELPELDPDDHSFVRALEDLGVHVAPAVWDDARVDWSSADVCVVRSTWDYHKHPIEFGRWVDDVSSRTRLFNPATLLHWNSHKFYLRTLEERGVPVVPTVWLERGAALSVLVARVEERGWSDIVLKPAYGASSEGILRTSRRRLDDDAQQLCTLVAEQDVLVQPYLATLAEDHERALVFIDGTFSHAVTKTLFMHANIDLGARAFRPPGASGEIPTAATTGEIALATHALEAAPPGHVYARVDIVRDGDVLKVIEVELIEPTLYFFANPPAADHLARAVLAHLDDIGFVPSDYGSRPATSLE